MLSKLIGVGVVAALVAAVLVTAFHPAPLAKMMAAAALAGLAVTVVVYLVGSVLVHGRQIVTYRSAAARPAAGKETREGAPR